MAHGFFRYCHQILHGCSNPNCETPTCLSCRRRVSEGPFRPYTVISARALATFLASQDQPGKGLCPYTFLNIDSSTLQKKEPTGRHITSGSIRKSPQSPRLSDNGLTSRNGTAESPGEDIHVGDAHYRPQEDDQISVSEGTTRPNLEEASKKDQPPRAIDTKSFTQSLFNTASMKSLHSSNVFKDVFRSYGPPSLEPSYATPPGSRKARSRRINAAAEDCSENVSDQNISPQRIADSPPTEQEQCISADKITATDPYRKEQERVLKDSTVGIHDTAPPSPRSLSHFSSANIRALLQALVQRHDDPFREHCFLRGQGRADVPSPPEKTYAKHFCSYLKHLAFIAQSISFVLSSPEALMMSFLICSSEGNSYTVAQSDPLQSMITSFILLKVLDFHPTNVLQSLWTSAAHIYPLGPGHESARVNEPRSLNDKRESLNNLEACHILKITFAALIASVPRCSVETMITVAKLRTSGAIASIEGLDKSLHSSKLSEEVLDCALAFDEEMPLSVLKRAVRAIATRHCGRKSPMDYPKTNFDNGNFFDQVTYYLLTDGIKVYPADQHASSLRGATMTIPQDIMLGRNLDQPLLVMIHWLQTLILKEWDGKPRIPKLGAVGGAIELLRQICQYSTDVHTKSLQG